METTVPAPPAPSGPIHIRRWPSEAPLTVLVVIAAILIWVVVVVSIVGIVYALFLALFFFFAHITFVAHVRGSGVRLTPEQFRRSIGGSRPSPTVPDCPTPPRPISCRPADCSTPSPRSS